MASNDVCTNLPTKGRLVHHQRSVLYTSLPPDVHKDFSHVPLFTEWLTEPKLLVLYNPSLGHVQPAEWKSPHQKLPGQSFWGGVLQLFTGLDFTYFLSGQQPAAEGTTSRNPSAGRSTEEKPILSLLEGRHCLVKHGQVFSGIPFSNVRSYCYF